VLVCLCRFVSHAICISKSALFQARVNGRALPLCTHILSHITEKEKKGGIAKQSGVYNPTSRGDFRLSQRSKLLQTFLTSQNPCLLPMSVLQRMPITCRRSSPASRLSASDTSEILKVGAAAEILSNVSHARPPQVELR
jgi:hypothetical protein